MTVHADVRVPPPHCKARVPDDQALAHQVPLWSRGCILDRGHEGQHRTCWFGGGSHDWGNAQDKLPGLDAAAA
jgi:hypothetical protein